MNGDGIMRWPDGRNYTGFFQDDMLHGRGVMDWPDGRRYDGEWNKGKQHGFGEYIKNNKIKYGMWKDGIKQTWITENQYTDYINGLDKSV